MQHLFHRTHYPSVASTMLCCDPSTVPEGHFLVVTADEQTAGRGQRGTTWESDYGQNLTFNIGWRPDSSMPWPAANEQFLISEVTALAVLRTIEHALIGTTHTVAIKWPNDIYVGDRKICGMLLEHGLEGKRIASSIAGIGINVNQRTFHSDAPNPVSLYQLLGHETDREVLLADFLRHFHAGIRLLQEGRYDEIERDLAAHLYRRTGWHRYRDAEGEFMGQFVSIARNGLLTLRKQDGTLHEYAFKEVAYIV